MVTLRILVLGSAILLAGCGGGFPQIRPVSMAGGGAAASRFDQHYEAGKASMMKNRVGLALVLFEKALAIDPSSVAALNGIGAAYDELHHPDLAARYYARALALEPNSADTLNNMGVSAMVAGKREEARTLFEAARDLDAGNAQILVNIAVLEQTARLVPAPRQTPRANPSGLSLERIGPAAFRLFVPPVPVTPRLPGLLADLPPAALPTLFALYGRSS